MQRPSHKAAEWSAINNTTDSKLGSENPQESEVDLLTTAISSAAVKKNSADGVRGQSKVVFNRRAKSVKKETVCCSKTPSASQGNDLNNDVNTAE